VAIFKRGAVSELRKTCIQCNKEKHGSEFFFMTKRCKKCYLEQKDKINEVKLKKNLDKIDRWRSVDLGIDCLVKDNSIMLFKSDLTNARPVIYKIAIDLYERGRVSVYKPNEVYLLFHENKWLKQKVILDSNYTCHYCGKYGNTVDHIEPVSQGGLWIEPNLVCSCKSCNVRKGNMSYEMFLKSNGVNQEHINYWNRKNKYNSKT
jgi:hypothetical protein